MKLNKLNPWNWFKHEDERQDQREQLPVSRQDAAAGVNPPASASGADSLLRLHQEMDRLFEDVFSAFGVPSMLSRRGASSFERPGASREYRPLIDVSGDEKRYEIALDVPGLSESDLSIEVKGDQLLIRGHKEEKSESKDKQFYRIERSYGAFQRTLSLPDDANVEDIHAQLRNGVLKLEIPRREPDAKEVKRIAIHS
ncbi:Hsp20/alpha crystallin family protein [Hahella sp. CR1]|uniref:Hsp20/alpha crystallin family protein n=1 Tax=Hahella sp. CR1 TaxID=2992807 RepID=UPI0024422113|nr:Hsp20/alpha crystallin family protein [Hahella sp. CR1]MDG9669347.1 Hsp20/alpha crystallin family protein [Hahella sp. CR1]